MGWSRAGRRPSPGEVLLRRLRYLALGELEAAAASLCSCCWLCCIPQAQTSDYFKNCNLLSFTSNKDFCLAAKRYVSLHVPNIRTSALPNHVVCWGDPLGLVLSSGLHISLTTKSHPGPCFTPTVNPLRLRNEEKPRSLFLQAACTCVGARGWGRGLHSNADGRDYLSRGQGWQNQTAMDSGATPAAMSEAVRASFWVTALRRIPLL